MSRQRRGATTDRRQTMTRRTAIERALMGSGGLAAMFGGLPIVPGLQQRESAPGAFRMRRVVTGHTPNGRSTVILDEILTDDKIASVGGFGATQLWGTSDADQVGARPDGEPKQLLPADRGSAETGGSRIFIYTFAPPKGEQPTLANRIEFHRTFTIDYQYVLTGAVWCVLDEKEVLLEAGDILIQRNTAHSWRVEGKQAARLLVTQVMLRK